jgi:diguanylate cyclase (GGDEF)-like protein/PAS domain S-box-containing protein
MTLAFWPSRVDTDFMLLLGRLGQLGRHLPRGKALPADVWARRHRGILVLLWLHVPATAVFALVVGESWGHAAFESSLVAWFAVAATFLRARRRPTTILTALGLLTASAVLVHLSGGVIEMHFHFFVMVGVVTLYQDWAPFLVAIGYVVVQHGFAGVFSPESVYNHQAAIDHPWRWAGIHGLFILGMSVAGIVTWRLNESLLEAATEREEVLSGTLSLLNATLDATADGILVVDSEGRITSSNQRFAEMWRLPEEILVARDDDAALGFVIEQLADPEAFLAKVRELYAQPDAESHDVILFTDGQVFERYSKPQRVEGETVGRVWSFRDVTERRRLEDELAHQAFHDPLTNLANQALFRDRVDHAVTRLERGDHHLAHLAVLFVDLDNFKHVNDSLGHTVGDQLLVAVTERLQGCLRVADTAARLGGDEFAILLEDISGREEATQVASRVIAALRRPFAVAGKEVFVGASIGIAFDNPGLQGDQLLRNADLAMYTAKGRGKDRYQVFEPEMHAAAVERLEVEADLRRAEERGELRVHYQPIFDLSTGAVNGVEALVRWEHPIRGLLAPAAFIPLAEETGLIQEIGRQVLTVACRQVRAWQIELPSLPPLSVSVNLSPRQLLDPFLVGDVSRALESTGLPASSLVLEITEGAMMHDTETTVGVLRALRELGVRLAVDDFGTGYSSLSYLQRFPIDVLKIDQSFVAGLAGSPEESALARAIVKLAQTLQLTAVAEGVETQVQVDRLKELGCELAQGYLLARPQAAEAVTRLLAAQPRAPRPTAGCTPVDRPPTGRPSPRPRHITAA